MHRHRDTHPGVLVGSDHLGFSYPVYFNLRVFSTFTIIQQKWAQKHSLRAAQHYRRYQERMTNLRGSYRALSVDISLLWATTSTLLLCEKLLNYSMKLWSLRYFLNLSALSFLVLGTEARRKKNKKGLYREEFSSWATTLFEFTAKNLCTQKESDMIEGSRTLKSFSKEHTSFFLQLHQIKRKAPEHSEESSPNVQTVAHFSQGQGPLSWHS